MWETVQPARYRLGLTPEASYLRKRKGKEALKVRPQAQVYTTTYIVYTDELSVRQDNLLRCAVGFLNGSH